MVYFKRYATCPVQDAKMDYFPLSVQENLICVNIDMVNVALYLKCIILKYMLETINYNKVEPGI